MPESIDAGVAAFDGRVRNRFGARRERTEQEQGGLVPRASGEAFAFEEDQGRADGRTEIFEAAAEREKVGPIIRAIARHGAVGLHELGQEIGRRDGLLADGLRQSITADGAFDEFGPGQELQEQPMVIGGVLAETAVGCDELSALRDESGPAFLIPVSRTAEDRPERTDRLEADRFRDAVVVLLRQGVVEMKGDAPAGGIGEAGGEGQPFIRRGRVIPESLDGERDGDQAEGGFLAAHPVGSAVRRITRHPVLERGPEEFDVTIIAVAQPGADEREGEAEAGKFPDALDVIRAVIAQAGPVSVRVRRVAREHAAGPAIRPTDFDELVREDPGVTAGESVGLGDGSGAGLDRPGFELRGEMSAIQSRDRKTRRMSAPAAGVEADGEFLPRAHRRTPFPDAQSTLARPARTPEEPARTEVMEEREEH